jgi:predicted signal transduction protein with EAL and GGDEF domain
VSANLSQRQLRPQLIDDVQTVIRNHNFDPARLVLEITESAVPDPVVRPIITALQALGAKLALDDFGAGYSSLGSVHRFPLDVVRLDRSLSAALGDERSADVTKAAVELGHALGHAVIAEGIETHTQLETLKAFGCPIGQDSSSASRWHRSKPSGCSRPRRSAHNPTRRWRFGETHGESIVSSRASCSSSETTWRPFIAPVARARRLTHGASVQANTCFTAVASVVIA